MINETLPVQYYTYIDVVEVVLRLLSALEVGPKCELVNLGALAQVHALISHIKNYISLA